MTGSEIELGNAYPMDDGTIVKTRNAVQSWEEKRNEEWTHETLHKSRKGRYWLEHVTQFAGEKDWAEWISNRRAVQWLAKNGHELPEGLKTLETEIEE